MFRVEVGADVPFGGGAAEGFFEGDAGAEVRVILVSGIQATPVGWVELAVDVEPVRDLEDFGVAQVEVAVRFG